MPSFPLLHLAFIVAFVASFNLGKYLINILTMSQDLGHTKVVLSSRGITNHCIPARDGRSKKCLKTKLDPGYTKQKSFHSLHRVKDLKGQGVKKAPRGSYEMSWHARGALRGSLRVKGDV